MRIPWFNAVVKNIFRIKKNDGKKMAYLYINKPPHKNEMDVEIEPEQEFMVIIPPEKMCVLNNLAQGMNIKVLVHLNSKTVFNKNGNEHIYISMRLCKLNIL